MYPSTSDPTVPASPPHTTTIRYARATAKFWVFETAKSTASAPLYATVYLRQHSRARPDFVTVSVTEGLDTPQVQAGRFMDEEEETPS